MKGLNIYNIIKVLTADKQIIKMQIQGNEYVPYHICD